MAHTTLASKYNIGNYRHAQPVAKANVYWMVRQHLGLSQRAIAKMFGISHQAWKYRERVKIMYRASELRALRDLSGLDAATFIELLDDCV